MSFEIAKKILPVAGSIVILCYFIALGKIVTFLLSTLSEDDEVILSGNDRYRIADSFYDMKEFYDFIGDPENINVVADFYNNLEKADGFDVLSVYDQALHVKEFKGDDRFYYNSKEFVESNISPWLGIKGMEINKAAFEFYDIEIDSGNSIPQESVLYDDAPLPVLLEAEYKGDSKFNLDTYIIIPYPGELWHVESDFQFEVILYFAMINCDILKIADEALALQEIKEIPDRTGFSAFSLTEVSSN